MKQIIPTMALALLLSSAAADAAVISTYSRNYGSGPGEVAPLQGGNLRAGRVHVTDNPARVPFLDAFDFSALAIGRIESLTLTLDYQGISRPVNERWFLNIDGGNDLSTADEFSSQLARGRGVFEFILTAATDISGVNAFAQAVATRSLEFWFTETTPDRDNFRLNAATLTVAGTSAPVPLPAPVWLLLSALAGLGLLRRRQGRTPAMRSA